MASARADTARRAVRARQTRQLEAVYAAVRAACDHPTAEQVHGRVGRTIKRISLGTVYRNLQKLSAQRRIRVVRLGPRSTRFDGKLDPHEHFVCEACGTITDLPASTAAHSHIEPLRRAGYGVTGHSITVFGVCPACNSSRRRR